MKTEISDEAALRFSAQLYSSIGFGHDLATAFKQARTAIALISPSEMDTPNLRVREGIDASDIIFLEGNA